jgi:hypothetical protein
MPRVHPRKRAHRVAQRLDLRPLCPLQHHKVRSIAHQALDSSVSLVGILNATQAREMPRPKLVVLDAQLFPRRVADNYVETTSRSQEDFREGDRHVQMSRRRQRRQYPLMHRAPAEIKRPACVHKCLQCRIDREPQRPIAHTYSYCSVE